MSSDEKDTTTTSTTGWIYKLKKDELQTELNKYGLNSTGTVDELRQRLANFAKGATKNDPTTSPVPPVTPVTSNINVLDQVRKWNTRFDGKSDPVSFLERIQELREGYAFTDEQMLQAVPELLQNKALMWARNNRQFWTTWDEFVKSFERFYIQPGQYQKKLDEEIKRRIQHPEEKYTGAWQRSKKGILVGDTLVPKMLSPLPRHRRP